MGPGAGEASDADGGGGDLDFGKHVDSHCLGHGNGIRSRVDEGKRLSACCGERLGCRVIGGVADCRSAVDGVAVAF